LKSTKQNMKIIKYVVLLIVLQFALSAIAQISPKLTVAEGTLEGKILPSGIQAYLGIPFAQPPVGNLRWVAPQPPKKWTGLRNATAFGNNAMQKNVFGDMIFRSPKMSEDCLYLNVWTSAKKPTEKLPVLVYFYGGGFIAGDGSENRYDGESMAKKGIVTVTLNYRLGIFGFFSHPDLTKESPNKSSGNYGLLDQNAALLWVKKNIVAFGGDPDKITIAGESAGSISVSAQMVSPLSKKLIAGAIGQSGAMINPTFPAVSLVDNEKAGVEFSAKANVTSIDALRGLSAEELLELSYKENNIFRTKAVVDGYFLTDYPVSILEKGEQANVPLLVGWTSTEMPYTYILKDKYPSPENYANAVKEKFGDKAQDLLKLYPGTTQAEVITSATALASDDFIVYSTWKWAEEHSKKQPVFVYRFSKPRPAKREEFKNYKSGLAGGISKDEGKDNRAKMPDPVKGASHASDIEYVLGNLKSNKVYDWTAEDVKVSALSETYFANFIKTGNPNGKGLLVWPVSKPGSDLNIMELNTVNKVVPHIRTERYLFLDGYCKSKK
jgi:para-nitrobenzyl esterase